MYEKVLKSSNQHYAAQVGYRRIPSSATIYFDGSCSIGILLYSYFSSMKSWIHHPRHISLEIIFQQELLLAKDIGNGGRYFILSHM